MKIIAINGSHRGQKSYTHFLVESFFQGAIDAGADCNEIFLSEYHIHSCKGCGFCEKTNNICIHSSQDDTAFIFEEIRKADIIVYASPIYLFTISSLLKKFLERFYALGNPKAHIISPSGLFFHSIDKEICSKPFLAIISHDNFEKEMSKNARQFFKSWSRFMDAPQLGVIVRSMGRMTGYGKNLEAERQFPKISESYNALICAGKEVVRHGKISRRTIRTAGQDIIDLPLIGILKSTKVFKEKALQKMNNQPI